MDLRGQDHNKGIVMPSSFVYNTSIRELTPNRPPHVSLYSNLGEATPVVAAYAASIPSSSSQVFDHHDFRIYHQQPSAQPPPPPPQQVTPVRHPPPPQEPQQQQQPVAPSQSPLQLSPGKASDPDPEPQPEPVAIAVSTGVTSSTPIGGGPKHSHPTTKNETTSILYRECLKNHAANTGRHVVDGCGEFMPSGDQGTPEALKCAACECHRSFHRREAEAELHSGANYYRCYNPNRKGYRNPSRIIPATSLRAAPPLPHPIQQHQKFPIGLPATHPSGLMPPVMMNFGHGGGGGDGGAATDSSTEEQNVDHINVIGSGQLPQQPHYGCSLSKKRFRTKFTNEQKEKMLEFAERAGWRMPKQDEAALEQFCDEVGVKRQVLKVWMHNNKHIMKKKEV